MDSEKRRLAKAEAEQIALEAEAEALAMSSLRPEPVPYKVWGAENIDPGARTQMDRAARLPVALRGALMPDAHVGYGLPIGGVLAVDNAVIPYAVGVDIACRMRMTIYDCSPHYLGQKRDKFRRALLEHTIFGAGRVHKEPIDHPVMHNPTWDELEIARQFKKTAGEQLGTSGSGNHFVEYGTLTIDSDFSLTDGPDNESEKVIPAGKYLALLSHSGSRRLGQEVANTYTTIAKYMHPELPKDYLELAWLDLNTAPGAEYWAGMTLAGEYAAANHQVIHELITAEIGLDVLGKIENHHNFAWKESITIEDGTVREAVVHRKGATPAGDGVLGVIPGSMSAPGFVVRGRGSAESLNSAAHGAGRQMSRSKAFKAFEWESVKRKLKAEEIELLGAGLDEVPGAYKDIEAVMAAQVDLVETVAVFKPMMVKMDDGGGRRDHRAPQARGEALD